MRIGRTHVGADLSKTASGARRAGTWGCQPPKDPNVTSKLEKGVCLAMELSTSLRKLHSCLDKLATTTIWQSGSPDRQARAES